jgi:prepilin-type N-terminal cleavage/methylation domain-containing protein
MRTPNRKLYVFLDSTSFSRRSLFLYLQSLRVDSEGFSLLEMVVVLAIIGILVAIQLPNVIGNTDKAKFIAAQTRISNAVTECATAKINGASELELSFRSDKFVDHVPSMENDPDGYSWDNRRLMGCSSMRLSPTDSDGNAVRNQGYPILMAKLVAGGRIIKVADYCRPFVTLDFTKDCNRWDPTNTVDTNYRTGRDLSTANWDRKAPVE